MADVLTPLSQPPVPVPMLHARATSTDTMSNPSQQFHPQTRHSQTQRPTYNGGQNVYRGANAAPVQPYAFQSTPNLRHEHRPSAAAPVASQGHIGSHRGHIPSASISSASASDTSSVPSAKDDSVMGSRPGSVVNSTVNQLPELSFTAFDSSVKPSPDRYRRPGQKRTDSNSSTAKAGATMNDVIDLDNTPKESPSNSQASVDDSAIKSTSQESAKRYRRRSLNTLDTSFSTQDATGVIRPASAHGATSTPTSIYSVSFHTRGTSEGTNRNAPTSSFTRPDTKPVETNKSPASKDLAKPSVNPRDSSLLGRRTAVPSPLSRQTNRDNVEIESPVIATRTYAAAAQSAVKAPSPAAQQLAAVSDKDLNKGMKSRLRRAFSFGSAQELRRAAMEGPSPPQVTRNEHHQRVEQELDAEQMEIARRQEAAGIGAGIYSGQGGFTGSTDNLSISSTASSASMMLRKMGRGAKKSAKSIKGLFRPKSVIGVPAADGPVIQTASTVQPTIGQVSMVTVEAERLKVNVNAEVSEKNGGVTGYPKLERNSIDAANAMASGMLEARGSADGSDTRRSIVGSEKDRAEVLASVKKGILKRSGTASPNGSPVIKASDGGVGPVPHMTESPAPSMPSTPRDVQQGRSASMNSDYFSQRMPKSMANTPNGSVRAISFSPRIQFHDAWSSSDYDRRGEIATCNRLTPMLAQQIKEELNTFKMEMEVHELSKPHTHFF